MKILVIGNGFLATPIVQRLEAEGHDCLIFSRKKGALIESEQIIGDIFNFEEFIKVLDWKPQVILHTAWITTPGIYRDHHSNFRYSDFTTKLAKFVVNSEVEHLIILGTCAEYGRQVGPSMAGLTAPSPSSLYAKQKVIAFNSVRDLLQGSSVRFTWARVFYPYGPNQDQNRLIPRLIYAIKNGDNMLLADTSSIYDWITTRDIASAISWIIGNNLPIEIDIGTSFGYSNVDLMQTIEDILQSKNPSLLKGPHDFGLNEVFVADKESPLFVSGWSPMDSLTSGLEWLLGR